MFYWIWKNFFDMDRFNGRYSNTCADFAGISSMAIIVLLPINILRN